MDDRFVTSPFQVIGLTREFVHLLLRDPDELRTYIEKKKRMDAGFIHTDTSSTSTAKSQDIFDAYSALVGPGATSDSLRVMAETYIHGTEEERYGLRYQLNNAEARLAVLQEQDEKYQKRLDDNLAEANRMISQASTKLAHLVKLLLQPGTGATRGNPEAFYGLRDLRHCLFSSHARFDRLARTRRDVVRVGRAYLEIGYLTSNGVFYQRTIEAIYPGKGVTQTQARIGLETKLSRLVRDPSFYRLQRWDELGIAVAFSTWDHEFKILEEPVALTQLKELATKSSLRPYSQVYKKSPEEEQEMIVCIKTDPDGRNLFRVRTFDISNRSLMRPRRAP